MAEDITMIYDGEPINDNPEQAAAERREQRARQAKLPKFIIAENEELYIPREQIAELNKEYFNMLNDMRNGLAITNEELRSYMESVVFESYKNSIYQLREKNRQEIERRNLIRDLKESNLHPTYEKKRLFSRKLKPNYSMQLCLKEAEIESQIELSKYLDDIERQAEFVYGDQPEIDLFAENRLNDLIEVLIGEFLPFFERRKYLKRYGNSLKVLLTEYAYEHSIDEVYDALLKRFIKEHKRQQFSERKGEYIKEILNDFFQAESKLRFKREEIESTIVETEAEEELPREIVAENLAAVSEGDDIIDTGDELDELHELEEELSEPAPVTSEERNTSPQEPEAVISITEEEQDKKPEEPDCLESEQLQIETDSGEKKQD